MTEMVVGDLEVRPNVGDEDYVVLWSKDGVLVLINARKFKSQYDTALPEGSYLIRSNGIQALPGNPANLLVNNGAGVIVGPDGSITLATPPGIGGGNRITLGDSNTIITPAFLTKAVADAAYETRIRVAQSHTFVNGQPVRLSGSSWVIPAAGAVPPADEWIGVVQVIDSNNFYVFTSGKATIQQGGLNTGSAYWWNGTAWTTTEPVAYNAFKGKIVAMSSNEGIVLPFRRRSGLFRPAQTPPPGAGRINVIFRSQANTLLCGSTGNASYYSNPK